MARPENTNIISWLKSLFAEDPRNTLTALYMSLGTSTVMATFGYLIGRKDTELLDEQKKLSETAVNRQRIGADLRDALCQPGGMAGTRKRVTEGT